MLEWLAGTSRVTAGGYVCTKRLRQTSRGGRRFRRWLATLMVSSSLTAPAAATTSYRGALTIDWSVCTAHPHVFATRLSSTSHFNGNEGCEISLQTTLKNTEPISEILEYYFATFFLNNI